MLFGKIVGGGNGKCLRLRAWPQTRDKSRSRRAQQPFFPLIISPFPTYTPLVLREGLILLSNL